MPVAQNLLAGKKRREGDSNSWCLRTHAFKRAPSTTRTSLPVTNKTFGERGFEPPETCAPTVFKTASFDRSDISPNILCYETKRIRTSGPQFRKLMLYPAELWSRYKKTKSERGGFEPPDPLPGQLLSREPDSATLAPLLDTSVPWQLSPTEREGFEPSVLETSTTDFESAPFGRSGPSPCLGP